MKSKRMHQSAFTLVELLIVIALISILSVAVLATINPIEQTNKARDAKFKNDAAEVLGAYERYYASQTDYPFTAGPGYVADVSYAIGSSDPAFGVVSSVGSTGVLIQTSELKSSFAGKESFQTTTLEADRMYAYNNGSDSNYVCFYPKATANKSGNRAAELKCLTAVGTAAQLLNISVACNTMPAGVPVPAGIGATANLMCVPEGTVQ